MESVHSHSSLVPLQVSSFSTFRYSVLIPESGIGKETSFELARLGFNVIIHGRNKTKLDDVREELLKEHPEVTVVCLVHDAAQKADWPVLMKTIEGLNITVLINNIGVSNLIPMNSFECATDEQVETIIRVNTIFPTQITRNILPTLIKNVPSLILNVTSGAALVFPPLLSVYAGTKSSNMAWSRALSNELLLLKRDVACKAVMTGPVQSDGYDRPTNAFTPSSKEYAASMLARAGSSGPIYAGLWRQSLQVSLALCMRRSPNIPLVCERALDESATHIYSKLSSCRGNEGFVRMAAKHWR